jgi:hypothetical protein
MTWPKVRTAAIVVANGAQMNRKAAAADRTRWLATEAAGVTVVLD